MRLYSNSLISPTPIESPGRLVMGSSPQRLAGLSTTVVAGRKAINLPKNEHLNLSRLVMQEHAVSGTGRAYRRDDFGTDGEEKAKLRKSNGPSYADHVREQAQRLLPPLHSRARFCGETSAK